MEKQEILESLKTNSNKSWNTYYDRLIIRGTFNIDRYLLVKIKHILQYKKDIKTILDLGCGNGELVLLLRKSGFKIKGIDYSNRIVNFLNNKYGNHFKTLDITTIDKDIIDKVDAILLNNVLEYLTIKQREELLEKLNYSIVVVSNKKETKESIIKLLLKYNYKKATIKDIPEEYREVKPEKLENIYIKNI